MQNMDQWWQGTCKKIWGISLYVFRDVYFIFVSLEFIKCTVELKTTTQWCTDKTLCDFQRKQLQCGTATQYNN